MNEKEKTQDGVPLGILDVVYLPDDLVKKIYVCNQYHSDVYSYAIGLILQQHLPKDLIIKFVKGKYQASSKKLGKFIGIGDSRASALAHLINSHYAPHEVTNE